MYFVGIDLAWSERNNTAISIIESNKKERKLKEFNPKIKTNKEIVDWTYEKIGNKCALISIDAPLVVPNKEGTRYSDRLITKFFRKYHAGNSSYK